MRHQEDIEAEVYAVLAASMEPGADERHTIALGGAVVALMWVLGINAYGRPSVFGAPRTEVQS